MGQFLSASERSLSSLLSENQIRFFIPDYQRHYKWSEKELSELWYDIKDLKENYFLGSIVLKEKKDQKFSSYDIIDGQQRITTLSILMQVILKELREDGVEKNEDLIFKLRSLLYTDKNNPQYLLTLSKQDKKSYLDIFTENFTLLKTKNPSKLNNIEYAYYFFEKTIKEEEINLQNLSDIIMYNLYFIKIIAYKNERKIFRVINNTGLDLTDSDIIKSYLLQNENKDVKKLWDNSFKDEDFWNTKLNSNTYQDRFFFWYLIIKYNDYKKDSLDKYFKEFEKNKQNPNFALEEMKNIEKYIEAFEIIFEEKNPPKEYPFFTICLFTMKTLKYYVLTPLLMKFYVEERESLEDVAEVVENFLVRSFASSKRGSSTQGINTIIRNILNDYKTTLTVSKKRLDSDLKESITNDDWTNPRAKNFFFLLEKKFGKKTPYSIEWNSPSLEHIYPKNPSKDHEQINEELISQIGNLCLLSKDKNWGNSTFQEKKEKNFGDLHLFHTSEWITKNNDTWGEKEIKARNEQILRWCLEFWPDLSQK